MDTQNDSGSMDPSQTPGSSGGKGGKIAAIVIVVLILLLAGWYVLGKKGSGSTDTKMASSSGQKGQAASVMDLMAGGKTQMCQVSYAGENSQSQGTVYVADGKFRGDFVITTDGRSIGSHMYTDGKYTYTWLDGQTTGYKVAINAAQQQTTPSQTAPNQTAQQGLNPSTKYNYDCSNWSVDQSKFALPDSVSFTDTSTMMQGAAAGGGTGASGSGSASATGSGTSGQSSDTKAQMCAACNSAPASAKAQCLASLGCK